MFYKTNGFKIFIGLMLGVIVLLLPRPEGTRFRISGDADRHILKSVTAYFTAVPDSKVNNGYIIEAKNPGDSQSTAMFLIEEAKKTKSE